MSALGTNPNAALLDVEDRVILVSGANRGIGNAIAKKLFSEGFRISLGVRSNFADDTLSDSDRVYVHQYDAQNLDDADSWVKGTIEKFGSLDGLINNAGVLRDFQFEDLDEEALDEMWSVNVKAPYRLSLAALPYLRSCGRGRIVNVVSVSGVRYKGGVPGYAITKHAAMALSNAMRYASWDDGVRVTALCPGETETDMTAGLGVGSKMTNPGVLAEVVSLLLRLPNSAAVNWLPINNNLEPSV